MSSILKALKKLEGERIEQQKVQSLSRAVQLKKGRAPGTMVFWRKPGFTGLMAVLVLLCTAGVMTWKYIGSQPVKPTVASVKDSQTPPADFSHTPVLKKMAAPVVEKKSFRESEAKPSGKILKPVSETDNIQPAPLPIAPLDGRQGVPEEHVSKKTVSEADHIGKVNPEDIPAKAKQDETSTPSVSVAPSDATKPGESKTDGPVEAPITIRKRGEEDIEILEDSNLKLMAIAWSDDPKSRIAVINDRIVREGDAVDGMVISRINEEDVILRKEDDTWKLLFRLK